MTAATISGGALPATGRKGFRLKHAFVLANRNFIKMIHTPEQFFDVTLQPIIFLFMFTYIFGGALAHGSTHSYLQFLLPGILGQTIAMSSSAIGTNMFTDIEKGVFDRFRSLPISRTVPLVGAVLADFLRYAIVCVVTLAFGYILGFRIGTNPLETLGGLLLAVLFAQSMAWISIFIGMTVRTAGAVQGIMILIILPLTFGSSTFVNPTTMPGWLQAFVSVNPMTHLIDSMRGLIIGGPIGDHVYWTLAWCIGLTLVFFPLALRAYIRKS